MTKNRIIRYAANTALLAVLAAAGIGVYQLGTAPSEEKIIQEETKLQPTEQETEDEAMVDAGTTEVEADLKNAEEGNLLGSDVTEDAEDSSDREGNNFAETESGESTSGTEAEEISVDMEGADAEQTTDVSAGALSLPELSFSEDTLMQWPVNGNILLDYNMDQTTYFPTLDQYKLSPAIAVQAVEGAPVTASVRGTVYSVEEDPQTGTTVTMELGDGYQAIYGQLKDLAVSEGETVEQGETIGYIAAPTK